MLGRDGRYRWTRWNTKTIPQEQLLDAIGMDISDGRPDDKRIHVGSWEWHLPTDELRWSVEMLDLLAITDGSTLRYDTFLQRVHPDDRQRVDRDLRSIRTSGEPYVDDFRIQPSDGNVRWLHMAGRAIPRADGTPGRACGIATDTTDRPTPGRIR